MARRILITILLTSLLAGAETYQMANVAGLPLGRTADGERAALPLNTYTGLTTWATGQMDGNQLVDFSPARSNLTIQSGAAVFDGVGDLLTFTDIPVGAGISSYGGTTTPTLDAVSNKITFTAGTCWDLSSPTPLERGRIYHCKKALVLNAIM